MSLSNKKYLPDYQSLVPFFTPQKGITCIIHQTYRTKNVARELADNINNLKSLNPGWVHRLYDDHDIEDFILLNYGQLILDYYQRISPKYGAAKADLFRYLLMYKVGGVYLDIKSTILKPLDDTLLPDEQFILSHWDNELGRNHENWGHYKEIKHISRGEYQQWHIIAAPGHPFLREMIIQVLKNIDTYNPYTTGVGLKGTLKTTGPIAYSSLVNEYCKTSSDYRLVDGVSEIGLKYSIYEEEFGCYHHKAALNSNYNYQIAPLIDNGISQGFLYRFYFKNIYNRIIKYEKKIAIIKREMDKYPGKFSFLKYLIDKGIKPLKK